MIGDACLGLAEAVSDFYPDAKWRRCIVHVYRNVFSVVPRGKVKHVTMMRKTIYGSEGREAAREKARAVIKKLEAQKFHQAAEKVNEGLDETVAIMTFPALIGFGFGPTTPWNASCGKSDEERAWWGHSQTETSP